MYRFFKKKKNIYTDIQIYIYSYTSYRSKNIIYIKDIIDIIGFKYIYIHLYLYKYIYIH